MAGNSDSQSLSFHCDRCAEPVSPGQGKFFAVRIEAFADPTPPEITEDDLRRDHRAEIAALLDRMQHLSEQEAMEQVYRRRNLILCNRCCEDWFRQLPCQDV